MYSVRINEISQLIGFNFTGKSTAKGLVPVTHELSHIFRFSLIPSQLLCLLLRSRLLLTRYDAKPASLKFQWTNCCQYCCCCLHGNRPFFNVITCLYQAVGWRFSKQLGSCPQKLHPAVAKYASKYKYKHKCTCCNYIMSAHVFGFYVFGAFSLTTGATVRVKQFGEHSLLCEIRAARGVHLSAAIS